MIRLLPHFSFKDKLVSKHLFALLAIGVLVFFCTTNQVVAQQLTGQWIGKFTSEEETGSGTDYVLEIEANGNQLAGYSYTYFSIAGKRYFVICRLKGTYDKGSKSMVINEVETVKTNTPPDFENCHQSHQLTYLKQKDKESLIGKWKPSEKGSTCGKGFTELERKALIKENAKKETAKQKNPENKKLPQPSPKSQSTPLAKKTPPVANKTTPKTANPTQKPPIKNVAPSTPPKTLAKENSVTATPPKAEKPLVNENPFEKNNNEKGLAPVETNKGKNIPDKSKEKLSKRTYQVIKVIEVSDPNIKVDIYDNGQVDGDIVSIYLNDKQLVYSKMLKADPITLNIKIDENEDEYDLIMYAESLGTIPPNTALMIVTTSTRRYEINISSDEQYSGAIRFKFKK